ncbi:hypothetical protein [Methylobacter svalbardensis]|uniref:hypothetical protein n=1 Tax=Methylobacter svalbardensis TaxID=3080016 RepID=UPI0030EC7D6F
MRWQCAGYMGNGIGLKVIFVLDIGHIGPWRFLLRQLQKPNNQLKNPLKGRKWQLLLAKRKEQTQINHTQRIDTKQPQKIPILA